MTRPENGLFEERSLIRLFAVMALILLFSFASRAEAQVATLDAARSGWHNPLGKGQVMTLALSHAMPYRVFSLTEPDRIVVDIADLDWGHVDADLFLHRKWVSAARVGLFAPGWSRLVLDLDQPIALIAAESTADNRITLRFAPTDRATFAARSRGGEWMPVKAPDVPAKPNGVFRVAIDPGHGGVEPGAIRGGIQEKSISLNFSLRLAQLLNEMDGIDAVLTRKADVFVSLDDRVGYAQGMDADLFVSIHADIVEWGNAEGVTVFTLSNTESDAMSAHLADFANRADLAAGLEAASAEDEVARMLFDMARTETNARSRQLGDLLVDRLREAVPVIRSKPHRTAGFRVLKAPDMPSVLIELGYMSSEKDRARLVSEAWQARAATAVAEALGAWADAQRGGAHGDVK